MTSPRIYLDHNATTPVRAEVVDRMTDVLRDVYGNPSSPHAEGDLARAVVEESRRAVASLVGAVPADVLFTGGATEANNTVIRGLLAGGGAPGHVVTSQVEHPSVDEPLTHLEAAGWRVTRVPVDGDGRVRAEAVEAALEANTALVSIILANNETGVLQPVAEIAKAARARGVLVHTDATQALGKLPVDCGELDIDLLSLSAHKFGGPKGAGCLIARGGVSIAPLLLGGPQEKRRRAGTENIAGIAGLGTACVLAKAELPERSQTYRRLRDRLLAGIEARVPRVRRNGCIEQVLPNTLNIEFEGTAGEVLLQALDLEGIAVSAGAACHSGSVEPSAVLVAMGRSPEQARGSLRWSLGHGVDEVQIDRVTEILPTLVERVRRLEAA